MHKNEEINSNLHKLLPILFCGMSIPLSRFMWLGDIDFSEPWNVGGTNEISPTRWFLSIVIPVLCMLYGLRGKGVNKSGAIFGLVCAITLAMANFAFFTSLAMFYFSGSRATKFRMEEKKKFEENFKENGQRGWMQALCNAGMATQLAILYLIYCGDGERPIDFLNMYRPSWLGIAVLSSFASSNGDTWGSELGSVLGSSNPILITTFKKVPRGTNGGVSVEGLLVSMLGGFSVGIAYYLTVICTVDSSLLMESPPQWPIILVGAIAGTIGSLLDSVFGALFQYSGIDENGHIVGAPGKNIKHISGYRILDNHSVNLVAGILTGIIMPSIAIRCWPSRYLFLQ